MNIDVKDKEFYTKQDRKIPEEELEIVNEIISEYLTELSEAKEITCWHVDVTLYSTAITLLERHGKLKEKKQQRNKYEKPGWKIQFEARISAIRKKLSQIDVVQNHFTKHQKSIEDRLKKKHGKITKTKSENIESELKHDLRVQVEKLRNKKKMEERKRINQLFTNNPKAVCSTFKLGPSVRVKDPPSQEDINNFWKGIWGCDVSFNEEADWLNVLKKNIAQMLHQRSMKLTQKSLKRS